MKTKSAKPGGRISAPEVTNVSRRGFWLLVDGREWFVGFARHPWFRDATVRAIFRVRRPSANHLHWPDLDVDLDLASLVRPADYPLESRVPRVAVRERAPHKRAPARRERA